METDYFFYGPFFGGSHESGLHKFQRKCYYHNHRVQWDYLNETCYILKGESLDKMRFDKVTIITDAEWKMNSFSQDTRNKIEKIIAKRVSETNKVYEAMRNFDMSIYERTPFSEEKNTTVNPVVFLYENECTGIMIPLVEETYNVFYKDSRLREPIGTLIVPDQQLLTHSVMEPPSK